MTHRTCSNVGEISTTTGTGAFALSAAITGMIRFNAIPSIATSDTVPYVIFSVDGSGNRTTEWEFGIGTYSAANQLTRTIVLGSSNSGSAVSFSSGDKYVFLAPLSEKLVNLDHNDAIIVPTSTLASTPAAGLIERDANCLYGVTDAGNRGVIPVEHYIRCDSTRTLPNDTATNAIFNSPANGRITLETGVYLFDMMIIVTGMSATSGSAFIDMLGAGSATVAAWLWRLSGIDNTTPGSSVDDDSQYNVTSTSAVITATTGTALRLQAKGTFEVTAGGTFIPSIDLVTAAAAVVSIGSYFTCKRIGSTTMVSVGQWD